MGSEVVQNQQERTEVNSRDSKTFDSVALRIAKDILDDLIGLCFILPRCEIVTELVKLAY
jgi:hypothetical protein